MNESAFYTACAVIGITPENPVSELLDSGNLRHFLAEYLRVADAGNPMETAPTGVRVLLRVRGFFYVAYKSLDRCWSHDYGLIFDDDDSHKRWWPLPWEAGE